MFEGGPSAEICPKELGIAAKNCGRGGFGSSSAAPLPFGEGKTNERRLEAASRIS